MSSKQKYLDIREQIAEYESQIAVLKTLLEEKTKAVSTLISQQVPLLDVLVEQSFAYAEVVEYVGSDPSGHRFKLDGIEMRLTLVNKTLMCYMTALEKWVEVDKVLSPRK